jgi:hypothetical protein
MCKYKQRKRIKNYFSYGTKCDTETDNIFKDPRYFIQVSKKIKKQIFIIIKKGKNGRTKKLNKNEKFSYYSSYRQHNKLSPDNIIRKLKRYFTHSLIDFVNKLYELELNDWELAQKVKEKKVRPKYDKWLQIINSQIVTKIAKNENLNWFDTKIKDYLSSEISPKCKNYNKNYNKEQIDKLFQENRLKDLTKFLQETNVRFMFEIYAKDSDFGTRIGGWYLKFLTLKNDIKQMMNEDINDFNDNLETNSEIEKYSTKIRDIAINLEDIFKNKRQRRKNEFVVQI